MEEATQVIVSTVIEMEKAGFKPKKVMKLLWKTNGDVAAVKAFLEAQKKLDDVIMSNKANKRDLDDKKDRHWKKRERHGDEENWKAKKYTRKFSEKMEKKDRKMHKYTEKKKKRDHKMRRSFDEEVPVGLQLPTIASWPTEVQTLYLDGNNMLFVLSALRSLVLKKRNMRTAENLLAALARKFTQHMKLNKCNLVYDDTNLAISEEHFSVDSARPSYSTTDDAFVDCAIKSIDQAAIYVTSDRGLIKRLTESNTKSIILKPKAFFHYVARVLSGKEDIESLDEWFEKWFEEESSSIATDMVSLKL